MLFAGDFRLSLPFILQVAPSPFGPVGYFAGVLWRLGTIVGPIRAGLLLMCVSINVPA